MPLYEYQCEGCKSKFEVLQRVNESNNKALVCPNCGTPEPKKVFSSFASLGSGKMAACETGST